MRFEAAYFLLLLVLIPLLHRWWNARNRPAKVQFPFGVAKTVGTPDLGRWLLFLRYAGLAALIIALARPQSSFRQTERTVSGIDIMMVMDVSASMAAEDIENKSRIDIAKETMESFIKARQNDRIGFLIFSGEPLTLAPPTLDYGLVLKELRDTELGNLKDGTAIGDGLSLAVSRLRTSTAKSRVIILLTDGDNNVGQVDPATAGELAAGYGIKVYAIAIGREGRVRLPIRRKGAFGNTITTYQWLDESLNPALLQQIAESTHGKFYRVTELDTLSDVFKEIDSLEKTEAKTNEKIRYEEAFALPARLGALLLILEQLLSRWMWRLLI